VGCSADVRRSECDDKEKVMRKGLLAVLKAVGAMYFASCSAQATEMPCGTWETSVTSFAGEGEGLNAHLCTEAPAQIMFFEITCYSGSLGIRFMPGNYDDKEDLSTRKVKLDYNIDGKSHVVDTQFEELDGAIVADVDTTDPLVQALTTGNSLILTLHQTKAFVYDVPLKGSKRAFAKLLRNCS
jgi:hypothetical protein